MPILMAATACENGEAIVGFFFGAEPSSHYASARMPSISISDSGFAGRKPDMRHSQDLAGGGSEGFPQRVRQWLLFNDRILVKGWFAE